jgi:secondary thiamine-phosphate synthase enzyme
VPVESHAIHVETHGNTDILDITASLRKVVGGSRIRNGIATVFCPSSTSAVTTIEFESGCLADLRRLFEEVVPANREYAHNARWGDGNGHSHVRAALLGASLTVPIRDGELTLGTWQQIVYVDFDVRPRKRELVLQLVGE